MSGWAEGCVCVVRDGSRVVTRLAGVMRTVKKKGGVAGDGD